MTIINKYYTKKINNLSYYESSIKKYSNINKYTKSNNLSYYINLYNIIYLLYYIIYPNISLYNNSIDKFKWRSMNITYEKDTRSVTYPMSQLSKKFSKLNYYY